MGELQIEVDPNAAGFDPDRLSRIDRHFAKYVDDGRLAGWLGVVTRRGRIVHIGSAGYANIAKGVEMQNDTIFRIFSMTKPITAVAAMMLWEEGAFELTTPVHRFIESFRHQRIYRSGSPLAAVTVPATVPMRIWHLLSHTAGLTYGFMHAHPVDAMYRNAGYEWNGPKGADLAVACDAWASMPLLFEPGSEWNYGVSSDVLGRVVEVASGQPLDQFFQERIFGPLGMTDTGFFSPEVDHDRVAELYLPGPDHSVLPAGDFGNGAFHNPRLFSGGGGLVSTALDYHRFSQMLANGGELDGVRLLGRKTVDYMTKNHLRDGLDIESGGRPLFPEGSFTGVGFGLGLSVVIDPVRAKLPTSKGSFSWGGAASTEFWVDPQEELTALFFTQLLPSGTYPVRNEMRQLVYQALID